MKVQAYKIERDGEREDGERDENEKIEGGNRERNECGGDRKEREIEMERGRERIKES